MLQSSGLKVALAAMKKNPRANFRRTSRPCLRLPLSHHRTASSQVEVEAKFSYSPADETRIAADPLVKLVKNKQFTDRYFDAPSKGFPLTTSDIWLRQRSGLWEVKIPVHLASKSAMQKVGTDRSTNTDSYVELEKEKDIHQFLYDKKFLEQAPKDADQQLLESTLEKEGFLACATLTTYRTTYKHGDVTIDLDRAEPIAYRVGELEIITSDGQTEADALSKIKAVAKHHNLNIAPGMRGKVLEYLRVFSPSHYQALDDCGLLKAKGIKK